MNYFKALCFIWALIGIGSRIIMHFMGEKWNDWELGSAYKSKKPWFINFIAIIGIMVVIYSWYNVFALNIKLSWIISFLVTSTTLKVSVLLFKYDEFRKFAVITLNDKTKMRALNLAVLILSSVLVLMGLYLY